MKKVIQNLKISQKLYVLVGVALVGMLMIGGMSFNLMGRLNETTSDISTSWMPSIDTARDMDTTTKKSVPTMKLLKRHGLSMTRLMRS